MRADRFSWLRLILDKASNQLSARHPQGDKKTRWFIWQGLVTDFFVSHCLLWFICCQCSGSTMDCVPHMLGCSLCLTPRFNLTYSTPTGTLNCSRILIYFYSHYFHLFWWDSCCDQCKSGSGCTFSFPFLTSGYLAESLKRDTSCVRASSLHDGFSFLVMDLKYYACLAVPCAISSFFRGSLYSICLVRFRSLGFVR